MEPLSQRLLGILGSRPWVGRGLALVAAALLTLGGVLGWSQVLDQWDERTGSSAWLLGSSGAQERRVVVVDIDEASVQALGPWPWPRERMAQLLQRLDQAGVGLKLLDVLFDAPRSGDSSLRAALASPVPTVPAQLFVLGQQPTDMAPGVAEGAIPGPCPSFAPTASAVLTPEAGLLAPTALTGHITPILDPDGAIRKVPAVLCYRGAGFLSLPLAGLWIASEERSLRWEPGTGWMQPPIWLHLGDWRIPLDAQGRYRVSYQIPRSDFVSVSAREVLRGQVPSALLRGAWVLVGATAFGAGDAVPTPLGGAVGGVEVHAAALAALLDERTPYTPALAHYWPLLTGLLVSILLGAVAGLRRSGTALLLPMMGILCATLLFGTHVLLLLKAHWWMGWIVPGLYTALATLLLSATELTRTRFERARLFQNLSSYLPATVARQVALQEPGARVLATRCEASVLFVALRNFSLYAESHSPEQSATVLHLFYTRATAVVEAHGGVVEQMAGDGLMAVWNGSEPCPDHPRQSLVAAEALWRALQSCLPITASQTCPPLDAGMGLETGTVLLGSFGPSRRRVHTVMGETVAVASALQALTAELAYPLLLGPQAAAQCGRSGNALVSLGQFLLPELARPRNLFAVPLEPDPGRLRLVYESETRRQARA